MIRKVDNTRVYTDGTVIDNKTGTRYTQAVKTTVRRREVPNDRRDQVGGICSCRNGSLSLMGKGRAHPDKDRCRIGKQHLDGVAGDKMEAASKGSYLPYQADTAAAAARARPKQSKLVTNQTCAMRSPTG